MTDNDDLLDIDLIRDDDSLVPDTDKSDIAGLAAKVTTNLMDDIDIDNADLSDLPKSSRLGIDVDTEMLAENVVPQKDDEFVCSVCFLIKHRSYMVPGTEKNPVCKDCQQ